MEDFLFSLSVAAIGMLVVFSGLVLLIVCITVITKISTIGAKKKEAPKAVSTTPVPAAQPAPIVQEGISPEVVAAITAAIAAVWQSDAGFRVRHIKRVNNAAAWNRAGREDQVYSRM